MGQKTIINNLHDDQDHRNPPSPPPADDLFEFFRGELSAYSGEKMMSHAEDIIFCGKLLPINDQLHRKNPPQQTGKHHRRSQQNHHLRCRRSRSESRSDVKTTTVTSLVRGSRSLGYEKLKRNPSMWPEPSPEITGADDGSGKKSSSSRWNLLLFGLLNVPPPEMDIRDLKNRQVRRNIPKTPVVSWESVDVAPVHRNIDHRKSSWRVLEFLSCKSASSAAVTTSLSYMAKV